MTRRRLEIEIETLAVEGGVPPRRALTAEAIGRELQPPAAVPAEGVERAWREAIEAAVARALGGEEPR